MVMASNSRVFERKASSRTAFVVSAWRNSDHKVERSSQAFTYFMSTIWESRLLVGSTLWEYYFEGRSTIWKCYLGVRSTIWMYYLGVLFGGVEYYLGVLFASAEQRLTEGAVLPSRDCQPYIGNAIISRNRVL